MPRQMSEEHKRKISEARLDYKVSNETKEKISSSLKGKTHREIMGEKMAREWKEKFRKARLNHSVSLEARKKISETLKKYFKKNPIWNKGKPFPKKTREKMSQAKLGKTHEEIMGEEKAKEWKEKFSKAMMGRPISLETRKKLSKAHKGKHYSPRTEFKKGNKYAIGNEKTKRGIPMSHMQTSQLNNNSIGEK